MLWFTDGILLSDLTNYCKNAQDPELRLYELNRLLMETIKCENRLFLDRIRVKHGVSDIEYGGLEEYVNENGIGAVLVATVKCLYRVRTKKRSEENIDLPFIIEQKSTPDAWGFGASICRKFLSSIATDGVKLNIMQTNMTDAIKKVFSTQKKYFFINGRMSGGSIIVY